MKTYVPPKSPNDIGEKGPQHLNPAGPKIQQKKKGHQLTEHRYEDKSLVAPTCCSVLEVLYGGQLSLMLRIKDVQLTTPPLKTSK